MTTANRLAETLMATRTDAIVAVSERERTLALELNPRVLVHVVPPASAEPAGHASLHSSESLRVAGIGRLVPQKDPFLFAEIASRARVAQSRTEFTWIGDGDGAMRTALERAGVVVTGWLDQDQALARLASSQVLLHTAAWEGSPVVFAEAASVGLPIVARRVAAYEGLSLGSTFDTTEEAVALLDGMIDEASWRGASDRVRSAFSGWASELIGSELLLAYVDGANL